MLPMRFYFDQLTLTMASITAYLAATGQISERQWPYAIAGLTIGFVLGLVMRYCGRFWQRSC